MPGPSRTDDPAVTSVAASTTAVELFAAAGGVGLRSVFNESGATLYLKYGSGAAANSYTTPVGPNTLYEFPDPVYSGQVTGIWTSASGFARCTEVA